MAMRRRNNGRGNVGDEMIYKLDPFGHWVPGVDPGLSGTASEDIPRLVAAVRRCQGAVRASECVTYTASSEIAEKCGKCNYFREHEEYKGAGFCVYIRHDDDYHRVGRPTVPAGFGAICVDGSDYYAAVIVESDFACIKFSRRVVWEGGHGGK